MDPNEPSQPRTYRTYPTVDDPAHVHDGPVVASLHPEIEALGVNPSTPVSHHVVSPPATTDVATPPPYLQTNAPSPAPLPAAPMPPLSNQPEILGNTPPDGGIQAAVRWIKHAIIKRHG